jgi:hypothetical protein
MTVRLEKAKARIESDIRKNLDEPYRSRLRAFAGDRDRRRAIEEELKERGGGYKYLAGAWTGTHGTPPELTE